MQAILKVITTCVLLLAIGTSAFVIVPAASNAAVQPASSSSVPNLTGSAGLIINSIFNASALKDLIDSTLSGSYGPQQQGCIDQYSVQTIATLSVGGFEVRKCVRVTGWQMEQYFLTHSAAVFDSIISKDMSKCVGNSIATLDCYANTICNAFTTISGSSSTCAQDDPCLITQLTSMIDNMDTDSSQLAQCLAQS